MKRVTATGRVANVIDPGCRLVKRRLIRLSKPTAAFTASHPDATRVKLALQKRDEFRRRNLGMRLCSCFEMFGSKMLGHNQNVTHLNKPQHLAAVAMGAAIKRNQRAVLFGNLDRLQTGSQVSPIKMKNF